ncbi:MAG: FliM/FliN family flagellar motor switch protein [Planctomycetales bacterium]|nr:FliM/FliN family flagellar motor switch protein [Planctomycetales bacterium]
MSELTAQIAAEVEAAAKTNAEEAAGALSRALDGEYTMAVGETAEYDNAAPPEDFTGPGLAVLMKFGESAAVAMLTQASGLTPAWAASPDATGESKLATLAQELSMLLVPDSLMADVFESAWVGNLQAAIERGAPAEQAVVLPLSLIAENTGGTLWMLWPLTAPDAFLQAAEPTEETPESQPGGPASKEPTRIFDFSQLPPYCRSLLKVRAPLSVALASKRLSVHDIMKLGAGSILSFDQPCDAPLDVHVGEQLIAEGEAVKVGERFGVKILRMVMPDEHFKPMTPKQAG